MERLYTMLKNVFESQVGRDSVIEIKRGSVSSELLLRLDSSKKVLNNVKGNTGGDPILFGGSLRDCFLQQPEDDFDVALNLLSVPEYKERLVAAYGAEDRHDYNAYLQGERDFPDMFDKVFVDIVKEIQVNFGHTPEDINQWFRRLSSKSYGGLFQFHTTLEGKKVHMILGDSNRFKDVLSGSKKDQSYLMSAIHMADSADITLNAIAMKSSGRLYGDHRFLEDLARRVYRERDRVVLSSHRYQQMCQRVAGLTAV